MMVEMNKKVEGRNTMDTKPFVLVCDDTRAIANAIVFMLQGAGYRAHAVDSALDCVAVARKDTPNLIIMDIMMPGMDGATTAGLMHDVPEIEGVPVDLGHVVHQAGGGGAIH